MKIKVDKTFLVVAVIFSIAFGIFFAYKMEQAKGGFVAGKSTKRFMR